MLKVEIGNEPHQELLVPFESDFIRIELKFLGNFWNMDLIYGDKEIYGLKLSSKVLMLDGHNLPFDIMIDDLELEIDPYTLNDFSEDIFEFNIVERDELESIRGYEVE